MIVPFVDIGRYA